MDNSIYSNVHGIQSEFYKDALAKASDGYSQVYMMSAPWYGKQYDYSYAEGWALLIPGYPITFVKESGSDEDFDNYKLDFIEDLSHIVDKFNYNEKLGRPRSWKDCLITIISDEITFEDYLDKYKIKDEAKKRKIEVFISLLIGSATHVDTINLEAPTNLLDRIKNKIVLFDTNQTRFIYQDPDENERIVRIQGLAGTGKTELLLHKLKDLFLKEEDSVLCFTCHNKVLADVLQKRLVEFFDAMGVNRQIDPAKLKCFHAWGSYSDENSGVLSFICYRYGIPFYSLRDVGTFDNACKRTLQNLKSSPKFIEGYKAFTYMFVDESQDFPSSFFELCDLVTKTRVYTAGDIFQNIFKLAKTPNDRDIHILLNKCYRTEPKTFMFAHGMGMGLFERRKVSWFKEDKEWEKCGYILEKHKNGRQYIISRQPVKRFEDIPDDYKSTQIYIYRKSLSAIVKVIDSWKNSYPNLLPDDIGIIMIDDDSYIYESAPIIAEYLKRRYKWEPNLAYITKKKLKETLFISNRNNVKGLEFPFVICLSRKILNSLTYRHTLYTMLSRSYLQSVLILNTMEEELKEDIIRSLNEINKNCHVTIEIPTEEQLKSLDNLEVKTGELRLSLDERIESILLGESLTDTKKDEIKKMLLKYLTNETSDEDLQKRINQLCQALRE